VPCTRKDFVPCTRKDFVPRAYEGIVHRGHQRPPGRNAWRWRVMPALRRPRGARQPGESL